MVSSGELLEEDAAGGKGYRVRPASDLHHLSAMVEAAHRWVCSVATAVESFMHGAFQDCILFHIGKPVQFVKDRQK